MDMQIEIEELATSIESQDYLTRQLITYLGNKRTLISEIEKQIISIRSSLGGRKLSTCDAFSGSGVVSRMLKMHSTKVVANDMEPYAAVISKAFLKNKDDVDLPALSDAVNRLNKIVVTNGDGPSGFIRELYAPKNDTDIQVGERVFYTNENARRIDAYAQLIRQEDPSLQDLLLAPLLSKASIHNNTGGVFKGFYKDSETGVGQFGGSGGNALSRILAPIELEVPVFSRHRSDHDVHCMDVAELAKELGPVDVVYLDPPYNQHPYGSNYFMLNLISDYKRPVNISNVSGIPENWKRSPFNKRQESFSALRNLIESLDARFILLSFSDDGFLQPAELNDYFSTLGTSWVVDIEYNTYRASRNLNGRSGKIIEHIFVLDRS